MIKSKTLNIVIIPPKSIGKKAMAISRNLNGDFVLDYKDHFPHITIYMAEFPNKNLERIKKALRDTTSKFPAFKITDALEYQTERGYIYNTYRKNRNLSELQNKIIEALNPLRGGLIRQKDLDRMATFTQSEQKNIKKYGYRLAGHLYNPHLTFTKFEDETRADTKKLKTVDLSFEVNQIGLYFAGEFGTCKDLITKYKLKK